MMPVKAVHIEDEPRNVELLKELVKEHCPEVEIAGTAKNVPGALELIRTLRPQLLYLDIELNDGNSFELLEQLKNGKPDFQVIFITAFNEYAVKAFRYNAVDYILKPISINDLKEATAKAVKNIKNSENNNHIFDVLRELRSNLNHQRIGLPVADGVIFVNADDIIRCEAKGGYTLVYLNSKKNITSAKTLKELEDVLPPANFVRVHNSWIVNTRYLKKYYRGKNSYMEMEDGSTVNISLRKKGEILSFLRDFE